MKSFTVRWTDAAENDLESIISYVADEDLRRAQRVLDRIENRAEALQRFPLRGKVVPELRWHGVKSYRQLIEKPWRIIYRVDGSRVWVHAVVDGRRSLEDLLLERFLRE